MLETWQAAILGVVQGLSEPLPISSSGHLALVPWLFDWPSIGGDSSFEKTFDVSLHLGTLVGVVAYFWRDIVAILAGLWRALTRRSTSRFEERLPWYIALATIPGAVFGALGEKLIEGPLGEPAVIGVNLVLFGLVLLAADRLARHKRPLEALESRSALAIGLAQAVALMPGVSRSGITMTAGLSLGFTREAAARFSFLISIPIIAGAVAYKAATTFVTGDGLPPGSASQFAWGIVTSGITGFGAVWFLLRYVRRHSFLPFVVYRIGAGIFVILVALIRA
ncbi:MAG: undecaprenyl-diphosphatase UppP [Actinomycetota bacterium]